MNKPRVSDVYKLHGSAVVSLPADSSLEDAIGAFIREPSVQGVFLVDANKKFRSMLTRIDLITWAHLQLSGGKGRHEIPLSEFFRIIDARKAKDLASGDLRILAVRENDDLQSALDKMLDSREDVIPVLDQEGQVLGDLRLSEVLWWVLAFGRRTTPG